MKFSALVTTLVLGISSAAVAAPATDESTFLRDHRQIRPMPQDGYMRRPPIVDHGSYGWKTLASNERLTRGRDAVQLYEPVRARTLKLEATGRGSQFIDKVMITFANGHTQVVELNKRLGRFQPLTIDVPGRSRMISRIVVFGRGSWQSSYSVLAA